MYLLGQKSNRGKFMILLSFDRSASGAQPARRTCREPCASPVTDNAGEIARQGKSPARSASVRYRTLYVHDCVPSVRARRRSANPYFCLLGKVRHHSLVMEDIEVRDADHDDVSARARLHGELRLVAQIESEVVL